MFELVTKLLLHGQMKFEKGRIELLGDNITILPADTIVEIQKLLEQQAQEHLIYRGARVAGKNWFSKMHKEFTLKSTDVFQWGPDLISLAGWGEVIVIKRDDATKTIVGRLMNSINSKLYGPSKKPVDHVFRGLFCGAMSFIFGADLEAVEVKCQAVGDAFCEFVVKPKKDFDFSNQLVVEQLRD